VTTAYWREYWTNPRRRSNPFVGTGAGQHRAEDIAKVGSSFDVPALRSGRVAQVSHQYELGHWFSVDVGNGRFDIYCHMQQDSFPSAGSPVTAGQVVGQMADGPRSAETTGTAWTGPQIHFVISDSALGATRPHAAFDPRPIIAAILGMPSDPTITPEDEDLPMNIQLILHVPTNKLILVDHLNRTMRDLGNSATDPTRAYYAAKPYTRAVDRGTTVPAGAVVWQDLVRVSATNPNGEYRYI
jgi:hypothetical protein